MNRTGSSDANLEQRILGSGEGCQYIRRGKSPQQCSFMVKHYAEPVTYLIEGLLEKNKVEARVCVLCVSFAFQSKRIYLWGLFTGSRKKQGEEFVLCM